MQPAHVQYRKNKTTELFRKLDKVIFFFSSANYWVDDVDVPVSILKAYKKFSKLMTAVIIFLIVTEYGAFFTQKNLSEKQKSDLILMTLSHFIVYCFTLSLENHRETVTAVLFALAVELKKDFNDEETERLMLKRTRFYTWAIVGIYFSTLVFYGVDAAVQVFFSDGSFVTVITVWPEVHDKRAIAEVARVGFYVAWWIWMCRVSIAYLLVLTITISLSHQYTNLQLYFKSIAGIFEERISQSDKEKKYERALKVGIRLHATTIWCTEQVQKIGGSVFSGQIIVNIGVLVQLMSQFQNSERTISNVLSIVVTIIAMLISTGLVMCTAGDITVEKPVVITSYGVISLSYQSYVSIVKTSYSVFSVSY